MSGYLNGIDNTALTRGIEGEHWLNHEIGVRTVSDLMGLERATFFEGIVNDHEKLAALSGLAHLGDLIKAGNFDGFTTGFEAWCGSLSYPLRHRLDTLGFKTSFTEADLKEAQNRLLPTYVPEPAYIPTVMATVPISPAPIAVVAAPVPTAEKAKKSIERVGIRQMNLMSSTMGIGQIVQDVKAAYPSKSQNKERMKLLREKLKKVVCDRIDSISEVQLKLQLETEGAGNLKSEALAVQREVLGRKFIQASGMGQTSGNLMEKAGDLVGDRPVQSLMTSMGIRLHKDFYHDPILSGLIHQSSMVKVKGEDQNRLMLALYEGVLNDAKRQNAYREAGLIIDKNFPLEMDFSKFEELYGYFPPRAEEMDRTQLLDYKELLESIPKSFRGKDEETDYIEYVKGPTGVQGKGAKKFKAWLQMKVDEGDLGFWKQIEYKVYLMFGSTLHGWLIGKMGDFLGEEKTEAEEEGTELFKVNKLLERKGPKDSEIKEIFPASEEPSYQGILGLVETQIGADAVEKVNIRMGPELLSEAMINDDHSNELWKILSLLETHKDNPEVFKLLLRKPEEALSLSQLSYIVERHNGHGKDGVNLYFEKDHMLQTADMNTVLEGQAEAAGAGALVGALTFWKTGSILKATGLGAVAGIGVNRFLEMDFPWGKKEIGYDVPVDQLNAVINGHNEMLKAAEKLVEPSNLEVMKAVNADLEKHKELLHPSFFAETNPAKFPATLFSPGLPPSLRTLMEQKDTGSNPWDSFTLSESDLRNYVQFFGKSFGAGELHGVNGNAFDFSGDKLKVLKPDGSLFGEYENVKAFFAALGGIAGASSAETIEADQVLESLGAGNALDVAGVKGREALAAHDGLEELIKKAIESVDKDYTRISGLFTNGHDFETIKFFVENLGREGNDFEFVSAREGSQEYHAAFDLGFFIDKLGLGTEWKRAGIAGGALTGLYILGGATGIGLSVGAATKVLSVILAAVGGAKLDETNAMSTRIDLATMKPEDLALFRTTVPALREKIKTGLSGKKGEILDELRALADKGDGSAALTMVETVDSGAKTIGLGSDKGAGAATTAAAGAGAAATLSPAPAISATTAATSAEFSALSPVEVMSRRAGIVQRFKDKFGDRIKDDDDAYIKSIYLEGSDTKTLWIEIDSGDVVGYNSAEGVGLGLNPVDLGFVSWSELEAYFKKEFPIGSNPKHRPTDALTALTDSEISAGKTKLVELVKSTLKRVYESRMTIFEDSLFLDDNPVYILKGRLILDLDMKGFIDVGENIAIADITKDSPRDFGCASWDEVIEFIKNEFPKGSDNRIKDWIY